MDTQRYRHPATPCGRNSHKSDHRYLKLSPFELTTGDRVRAERLVAIFSHRSPLGSVFRFAELFCGSAASLINFLIVVSLARGPIYCLIQKLQGFG